MTVAVVLGVGVGDARADVTMLGGYVSDANHWRTTNYTDDSERLFVIVGADPGGPIIGTDCRVPWTGVSYWDDAAFPGVSLGLGSQQFTLISTSPPGVAPWQTWLNLGMWFQDGPPGGGGTSVGLNAMGPNSFPFGKFYVTMSGATWDASNIDRVGRTCVGSDGGLDSVGHFTVTVVYTPEGDIEALAGSLSALIPTTLSAEDALGPLAILDRAEAHARILPWTQFIEKGNAHNAINELNAFISAIEALANSQRLDRAVADELIARARTIIPWIKFFIYDAH